MPKLAVKSNGVGREPEMWLVPSDARLVDVPRADFFVRRETLPVNPLNGRGTKVVAEDGASLRDGTEQELRKRRQRTEPEAVLRVLVAKGLVTQEEVDAEKSEIQETSVQKARP